MPARLPRATDAPRVFGSCRAQYCVVEARRTAPRLRANVAGAVSAGALRKLFRFPAFRFAAVPG